MTPPTTLDYERWVGPAPMKPYIPAHVHQNWRWVLDYVYASGPTAFPLRTKLRGFL